MKLSKIISLIFLILFYFNVFNLCTPPKKIKEEGMGVDGGGEEVRGKRWGIASRKGSSKSQPRDRACAALQSLFVVCVI